MKFLYFGPTNLATLQQRLINAIEKKNFSSGICTLLLTNIDMETSNYYLVSAYVKSIAYQYGIKFNTWINGPDSELKRSIVLNGITRDIRIFGMSLVFNQVTNDTILNRILNISNDILAQKINLIPEAGWCETVFETLHKQNTKNKNYNFIGCLWKVYKKLNKTGRYSIFVDHPGKLTPKRIEFIEEICEAINSILILRRIAYNKTLIPYATSSIYFNILNWFAEFDYEAYGSDATEYLNQFKHIPDHLESRLDYFTTTLPITLLEQYGILS